MFGYTIPLKLDLTLRETYHYKAHYCGLCGALSRRTNFLFRLATGYEATLLSLLVAAQRKTAPKQKRLFCPVSGELGRGVIPPDDLSISFAADATLLMGYYKLKDLKRDKHFAAPLLSICSRPLIAAKDRLATSGLDVSKLDELDQEQSKLEIASDIILDDLLIPTGQAVGLIFAYTASLTDNQQNTVHLFRLGEALGKLVYLLDCLEDWPSDLKKNRFNGLLASGLKISYSLDDLVYVESRLLGIVVDELAKLNLYRYHEIFHNIMALALPKRTNKEHTKLSERLINKSRSKKHC